MTDYLYGKINLDNNISSELHNIEDNIVFLCSNKNFLVYYNKDNDKLKIVSKNNDTCEFKINDGNIDFVLDCTEHVYITNDDILLFKIDYKLFIYGLSYSKSSNPDDIEIEYTETNPLPGKPANTVRLLKAISISYIANDIGGSVNNINLICTDNSLILECSYLNKRKIVVLKT